MNRVAKIGIIFCVLFFSFGAAWAGDVCVSPSTRYIYRSWENPPANVVIYKAFNRLGGTWELDERWKRDTLFWHERDSGVGNWIDILIRNGEKEGFSQDDVRRGYSSHDGCVYKTGYSIYQKIANELGEKSPYLQRWVRNQNEVYAACSNRGSPDELELETDPSDPARAADDHDYQKASFYFYKKKYQLAEDLYKKILEKPGHLYTGYASYMLARNARMLGKDAEAYDLAVKFGNDKALAEYSDLFNELRFVIGYGGCVAGEDCLKMHAQHLAFMRDNLLNIPDIKRAKGNYLDSDYQLDFYLTGRPGPARDGWWFSPGNAESPRQRAYAEAAKKDEFFDWMQVDYVANPMREGWFTYLYYTDKAKEIQNAAIDHAVQRWKAGDGDEWLYLAAQRVYPDHPAFTEIAEATQKLYERLRCSDVKGERLAADHLWPRTIFFRIYHDLPIGLPSELASQKNNKSPFGVGRDDVTSHIVTLFLHQKRFADIEKLAEAYKITGYYNSSLLGVSLNFYKTPDEALAAIRSFPDANMQQETLAVGNMMSVEQLLNGLEGEKVPDAAQGQLARVAFVRSVLLNEENLFERAAQQVVKTHPFLKDEMTKLLHESDGEPSAWQVTYFLLKNPRFNSYADPINYPVSYKAQHFTAELPFGKIDPYNHRDNNWWCQSDPERMTRLMQNRLFRDHFWWWHGYSFDEKGSSRYRWPRFRWSRSNSDLSDMLMENVAEYDVLSAFLAYAHSDEWAGQELAELAKKPGGAEYLAIQSVKEADNRNFIAGWLSDKGIHIWDEPPIPEMLHRSVKVSRYGCGGGGDATYKAFRRLHFKFPDSAWTKLTPYWFDKEDKR